MPVVKGRRGNPTEQPSGARNRATLRREAMLDAAADDLIRELIAKALAGDDKALRLCIDRVLPRRPNRPIPFELPRIDSAEAARQAVAAIIAAAERSELAPREANELLQVIERGARIIAATKTDAAPREEQSRRDEVTWPEPTTRTVH